MFFVIYFIVSYLWLYNKEYYDYYRNFFKKLKHTYHFKTIEASRISAGRSVTVKPTGCRFDPHFDEMKYLLKFQFLRSGVEVKRDFEFCHSTRNASRIR